MTIALSKTAQSIPPNVFKRMDRTVAQARARGVDVIDLSKGNPDGFPEARIRAEAKAAVDRPENARYTPFDGKPLFLQAAAAWYAHEHSVALDPGTQLFAVEGAVDGLGAAFAVLLDPGDVVAFVDPYYPSYHCMARMLGAEELPLPARAELGWLPDLDAVPGARDGGIEIVSLSKMYAMAGWRAGFVAGNEQLVAAIKQYHYQMGSMVTSFVQDAGAAALAGDQAFVREQAARYAARRAIVAEGLRAAGYNVFASQGGLYVWAQAPAAMTGEELAARWLDEAGVAALPGSCFGRTGAQYVRLSLLQPSQRLHEAVARIGKLSPDMEKLHA